MQDKSLYINDVWYDLMKSIMTFGTESRPRGMLCQEVLNNTTCIDMKFPILSVKARKLGYRFLFAEAWWILSGKNDVASIRPYSKMISRFSNDGHKFDGAYGPKIVDQLRFIVDTLVEDINSRQAVLTIWRPNPRPSKDIPCTISVQWLIRDGKINCIDTMRSSDIWLGWPYDVFNFSMLTGYIMLMLRERGVKDLELGNLYLNAGSHHIYADPKTPFNNIEKVQQIIKDYEEDRRFEEVIYKPFKPFDFNEPQDLINFLQYGAENNVSTLIEFGREFIYKDESDGVKRKVKEK